MFVVRDPISRFVSAFIDRFHNDHPRYHYPWRYEERVAFAVFTTPEQLGTALASHDDLERSRADRAMRGIAHLNTSYWYWFGDESAFQARLSDLFFVGFQERLDEDFEIIKCKLGLPPEAHLPSDPIAAHRSLHTADQLGSVATANLELWFERDLAFVGLCREVAPVVNWRTTEAPTRARLPVRPTRRALAAATVLTILLALITPEMLGDRPYDPIGQGSILERIEHKLFQA